LLLALKPASPQLIFDGLPLADFDCRPLDALGYVGLGASWNGGMKGAELWVAQLVDGDFSLNAFWSEDYKRPQPSAASQAALSLLGWTSTPGGSVWAFTRPAAAADADRSMALGAPMGDIMLWALGTEPGEFGYHGASTRGSSRVLLAASSAAVADIATPSDAKVVRVLTPPVATDGTVSRYCWSWHKLPADRRYHITSVAPLLVHPELKSLVHHMVTYACPASFEQGGGGADGDTLRAGGVVCRDEGALSPALLRMLGGSALPAERGLTLSTRRVDAAGVSAELHRLGGRRVDHVPAGGWLSIRRRRDAVRLLSSEMRPACDSLLLASG